MSEENIEDNEVELIVTFKYSPTMKYYPKDEVRTELDAVQYDFGQPESDWALLLDNMDIAEIKARYPGMPMTETVIELNE